MKKLLYFYPLEVGKSENYRLAGFEKFSAFSKIFKARMAFIDRTGTITTPVRTKSVFPIPALRPFSKTYEEICNERAAELLHRSEISGLPLYVLWSGGIDSTLALTSLLKNSSPAQRANITVLLNEESIMENPNFYRNHIQRKLQRAPSSVFIHLLGGRGILVSGEHNDQLFGAEAIGGIMKRFGADVVHKPYDRTILISFLREKIGDPHAAEFYGDIFERIRTAAPIDIVSNHDVMWWFSFSVKWQSVFLRTIAYTTPRNMKNINVDYINRCYAPFYNTEDFQLWSMCNPDKKIKNGWNTYKWPAKDIIYDFTKDAAYRDHKTKRQSLRSLIARENRCNFIDESMSLLQDINLEDYYEPRNDFV